MGKGRITHFGFAGAREIFEAEAVPYRSKHLGIDNHLRNIAIREGLPALSSPMVGEFWKAIILLKRQYLRAGKWSGYGQLRHSSFDAYLNSELLDHSAESVEEWEECCGYPGLRLSIARPRKVMVRFREENKFEERRQELVDFPARLLLHEFDHIECIDPLKKASRIEIVDAQLKEQFDGIIQPLFSAMAGKRQPGDSFYHRSQQFNQLRREIAFCITDHYRK